MRPSPFSITSGFYGWRMVAACFLVASTSWSLGLFGASVYLHVVSETRGWPISLISTAVTGFYLLSALSSPFVGTAVNRLGPRAVVIFGACSMAAGVASIGQVYLPWQVYFSFLLIGLGWACLSSTAISTILAPWFDKHQGRAVSTALMGASIGGIFGVPALLFAIDRLGFAHAMLIAACICLALLLPLSFVLRSRPGDFGLLPDGAPQSGDADLTVAPIWTRTAAAKTILLRSVVLAFGIAFMVQVGFLTHHLAFLAPYLGDGGASAVVSATAIMAFLGRIVLARYVDGTSPRLIAGGVFCVGAAALALLAFATTPALLVIGSLAYGLTVGNVTTLPSIIVRGEFGADSFGAVYGLAAMPIGLCTAIGPSFYGALFDASGGYALPMIMAAVLNAGAAAIILFGRRSGRTSP
jgi:MFS family permease